MNDDQSQSNPPSIGTRMTALFVGVIAGVVVAVVTVLVFASMFPTNKSATYSLQKDYKNLKDAAKGTPLEHDWALWKKLSDLRLSKRGAQLPSHPA